MKKYRTTKDQRVHDFGLGFYTGMTLGLLTGVIVVSPITVSTVKNDEHAHVEVREVLAVEETQEVIVPEVVSTPAPVEVALDEIPHETETTTNIIKHIYTQAPKLNINPDVVARTIYCESMFYNIQSGHVYDNGVRENSWGIAQISLDHHPDVSWEQAMNPLFAVEWMLEHWHTVVWYGYDRDTETCNNGITGYWE